MNIPTTISNEAEKGKIVSIHQATTKTVPRGSLLVSSKVMWPFKCIENVNDPIACAIMENKIIKSPALLLNLHTEFKLILSMKTVKFKEHKFLNFSIKAANKMPMPIRFQLSFHKNWIDPNDTEQRPNHVNPTITKSMYLKSVEKVNVDAFEEVCLASCSLPPKGNAKNWLQNYKDITIACQISVLEPSSNIEIPEDFSLYEYLRKVKSDIVGLDSVFEISSSSKLN
jgi:hypothetical protein